MLSSLPLEDDGCGNELETRVAGGENRQTQRLRDEDWEEAGSGTPADELRKETFRRTGDVDPLRGDPTDLTWMRCHDYGEVGV